MVITKRRKSGARHIWSKKSGAKKVSSSSRTPKDIVDKVKQLCKELGYSYSSLGIVTKGEHDHVLKWMEREKALKEKKASPEYHEKMKPRRVPKDNAKTDDTSEVKPNQISEISLSASSEETAPEEKPKIIEEEDQERGIAKVAKWGFGCAPMKPKTIHKNKRALSQVLNYIMGIDLARGVVITDEISIVKGLFNRILRQDQWDWFTTNMYFDYPRVGDISAIVDSLILLRKSILIEDDENKKKALKDLQNRKFQIYASNYLDFDIELDSNDEYIYILSRREEKELLKIGRTTRNVIRRVNEINSATGIVYPFSPRKVFRVTDCGLAEKLIHSLLSKYRIRDDREFFTLPYGEACELIDECLKQHDLHYYKY